MVAPALTDDIAAGALPTFPGCLHAAFKKVDEALSGRREERRVAPSRKTVAPGVSTRS